MLSMNKLLTTQTNLRSTVYQMQIDTTGLLGLQKKIMILLT